MRAAINKENGRKMTTQVKNRIDDSLVDRLLFYAILYIVFDGYVYLKNIL